HSFIFRGRVNRVSVFILFLPRKNRSGNELETIPHTADGDTVQRVGVLFPRAVCGTGGECCRTVCRHGAGGGRRWNGCCRRTGKFRSAQRLLVRLFCPEYKGFP